MGDIQTIMRTIGFAQHWTHYEKYDCAYIRREAVRRLPYAVEEFGLTVTREQLDACRQAQMLDAFFGDTGVMFTWICCRRVILAALEEDEG